MLLGCIGDDFTGSSDIANTLAKGGMQVVQYTGIPDHPAQDDVDAGVVSLKSRTIPVKDAVAQAIQAANWLKQQGCEQIFFKICSTFDSTPEGNIGPVTEALAQALDETSVLICPAFPTTGRSVYQGHLFVNDTLLSDSSLKDHPLTPMTDSDIRRWLSRQTAWPVKHIPHSVVQIGPDAIIARMNEPGLAMWIADAISDDDLLQLGRAAAGRRLLTGGSGLALGLPANFNAQGKLANSHNGWAGRAGRGIILSGSCSQATRHQVAAYASRHPNLELNVDDIVSGRQSVSDVGRWALEQGDCPLMYTSAEPDAVRAAQNRHGRDHLAQSIETFFGDLARLLVDAGTARIVTAGGETSGAVVTALEIDALQIGPEIAPGVPAVKCKKTGLTLALKSGNFGGENFFEQALEVLAGD